MIPNAMEIAVSPLVPWAVVVVLGVLALAAAGLAFQRRARGAVLRAVVLGLLTLALVNPSIIGERREPRDDVVVVAVDRSASQSIGVRDRQTDGALAALQERLGRIDGLQTKVVTVTDGGLASGASGSGTDGTRLMSSVRSALADVPAGRLAGVIAITDGQVHDLETVTDPLDAPFHVLLTGTEGERDRRLRIERAPAFGMVGKTVTATVEVIDPAVPPGTLVTMEVRVDGGDPVPYQVPANRLADLELPIDHGGQTILELSVEPGAEELTLQNNRAVVAVNGVRDRLRVLLVSGSPHAGERTWRDILKSDPSVDLVHFTILRPPEKQDGTPIRELSLIAFPVRELFELKLEEFDLIIFDRYRRRGVLPRLYLRNIAEFVEQGGAFLEASGPTFASRLSLARTPLGTVLPAEPTGEVLEFGFKPRVTTLGDRHPVTANLAGAGQADTDPSWGRWFRQIDAVGISGTTVMTGIENRPLLVLDRVGEGRVAHLLSDHLWLWSRGYEGGGPQAELLRRTAHWLMREPDLEEDDLRAISDSGSIEIRRRKLEGGGEPVQVTAPDGTVTTVDLEEDGSGLAIGRMAVTAPGLYRLTDGSKSTLVAVGALNPIEYSDVAATAALLTPQVEAEGGAIRWIGIDGVPSIRRVGADRSVAGRGWVGLRTNGDYVVTGVLSVPALPAALALIAIIGGLLLVWRRESQ
ncbi:MAG: hypothetical protein NXI19_01155 [Alphaproteobacteria bacterium]|nr:hypothetical protein [Alphaproteobacteria bacterium]